MGTDRLNPWPLFSAHWKCLTIDHDDGRTPPRPDWWARIGLLLPAVATGGALLFFGGRLPTPGYLLSADALLASGLLAVFAQISALRLKLAERHDRGFTRADDDKDAMDESATHLLFATMLAFINAAVLIVSMAVIDPTATQLAGPGAAISGALFVYIFLLLLMLLPRLLYAYTTVNGVRDDLSGFHQK